MLTEYACTRRELSCLIGNLFTEIEPPCERCGAADVLTISGTTYTGSGRFLPLPNTGSRGKATRRRLKKSAKGGAYNGPAAPEWGEIVNRPGMGSKANLS